MLLAVDIGNTSIALGVYRGKSLVLQGRIATRLISHKEDLKEKIKCFFSETKENLCIKNIIISCVVPPLKKIIMDGFQEIFSISPCYLETKDIKEIKIDYPSSSEIGIDRIVNAVAAVKLYQPPIIIVDSGTAITFDVISKEGVYLGGTIAPGIEISMIALSEKAKMLPRIKLSQAKTIMGIDTVSSIESGIYFGFKYLMEGIMERIKQELNILPFIVMTGGLSEIYRKEVLGINVINLYLTLEGLRIIHENRLSTSCG
ncbi:MAG: type III pantothenate kinase [bacterium]|nr:type III pantothenate kinase [bacterium]